MIVALCAGVALLSLVTGDKNLRPFPRFVYGNLLGILVPLPLFLLLCTQDRFPLGLWWAKAPLLFGIDWFVETAQSFGYSLFGRTFDLCDIMTSGHVQVSASSRGCSQSGSLQRPPNRETDSGLIESDCCHRPEPRPVMITAYSRSASRTPSAT